MACFTWPQVLPLQGKAGWALEEDDLWGGCPEFIREALSLMVRKQGAWVAIISRQSSAAEKLQN